MTTTYTYNDDNLLTKVNSSNGTSSGILTDAQEISYTSFGRPNCISEKGNSLIYTYNSNYERAKIKSTVDNNTVTKLSYANGKYRRIRRENKTIQRLYLGGDAYTAFAVLERKDKNNRIYYLHRDYLGSITGITDSEGNLQEEYSYTAWGRLRNPKSWEVYAVGSEPMPMFGRGYTGHEHLSAFGLINMNARLYDAGLGRFLSPDPFVQSPDFIQNFNRYSYALNNPLIYTDPSGEIPIAFIIGAVVGAYLGGTATNDWQWDPGKWDYNNLKTYFGIVGGGLAGGFGGQWLFGAEGVLAGGSSLNVSLGATFENVAATFADISIGGGAGLSWEGLGYATIAGGGAYFAGSTLKEMFSTKSKSITISTSTPFDGNGLRGGYGVSIGQFEGKDSQGLYLTTYKGEGVSLSFSLDKTYYQPLLDRPVNIQDLAGDGYSLEFGLSILGYSHGNNGYVQEGQGFHYVQPTYRSHTISVSYGMDIGYANWETKTRVLPMPKWLYKLFYPKF